MDDGNGGEYFGLPDHVIEQADRIARRVLRVYLRRYPVVIRQPMQPLCLSRIRRRVPSRRFARSGYRPRRRPASRGSPSRLAGGGDDPPPLPRVADIRALGGAGDLWQAEARLGSAESRLQAAPSSRRDTANRREAWNAEPRGAWTGARTPTDDQLKLELGRVLLGRFVSQRWPPREERDPWPDSLDSLVGCEEALESRFAVPGVDGRRVVCCLYCGDKRRLRHSDARRWWHKHECRSIADRLGLSNKERRLLGIALLCCGPLPTGALASMLGVDERTVRRWKAELAKMSAPGKATKDGILQVILHYLLADESIISLKETILGPSLSRQPFSAANPPAIFFSRLSSFALFSRPCV
jgi:hypothetical protein